MDPEAAEVKASGGVVWRRAGDGPVELVVVHRPRYDDWSLPKGKLDPGETWEEAALREVEEEIGLRCRLGEELPPVGYRDNKGRAKAVRYWLMEPDEPSGGEASGRGGSDGGFTPNDEVDEMRWLDVTAAAALLSYPHDAELVRAAGERL
jgi:8-oxo-dGTP diphosphatase